MTDREQEARQAALTEYSHSKVRDRYDADLMMAGFQDGVAWADAHRSPEPPADVREALKATVEPFLDQALGDYGSGSYDLDQVADAILSRFRLVPLGAEPDEASDRDVLRRILSRFDPSDVERTITAIRGNGFARPDHDAEPDEDTWEYAAGYEGREDFAGRWFAMDDWYVVREAAEREVERYTDSQIVLIRRRRPGTAEPVTPRGEHP